MQSKYFHKLSYFAYIYALPDTLFLFTIDRKLEIYMLQYL